MLHVLFIQKDKENTKEQENKKLLAILKSGSQLDQNYCRPLAGGPTQFAMFRKKHFTW